MKIEQNESQEVYLSESVTNELTGLEQRRRRLARFDELRKVEELHPGERRAIRGMPFCVCVAFLYQLIFTVRGIIFHPPWEVKPSMHLFLLRFLPPFLLIGIAAVCAVYLSWRRVQRRAAVQRVSAKYSGLDRAVSH